MDALKLTCTVKKIILGTFHAILCVFLLSIISVLASMVNNPDIVKQRFQPIVDQANLSLESVGITYDIDLDNMYVLDYTIFIFKVLIVVLVVFFLVCLFSLITLFTSIKINTIIYIILTSLFLVAYFSFFVVIITGRSTLAGKKISFKADLVENYEGLFSTELKTVIWNFAMCGLSCCGVDGYEDFEEAKLWTGKKNITLGTVVVPVDFDMPLACCKREVILSLKPIIRDFVQPAGTFAKNHSALMVLQCALVNNTAKNNMYKGCYDAGWDKLDIFIRDPLFIVFNVVFMLIIAASIICNVISLCT